jgi:hypothetical protein
MNIRFLIFPTLLLNFFVICGTTQQVQLDAPVKPRLMLPKLQFWQSSYSQEQVVTAALNYFNYNRLKLTENDIDDVIAEINYYAYILRIDNKKIFRGLCGIIEKKLMYHKERIINRNHYKNLVYDCAQCIGLAALSAAFVVVSYAIYKKWDQTSKNTIDTITQELNQMDIKVITDYDYDFKMRFVRLIPPMELSDQQINLAKDYQTQLKHLFRVKDWANNMEIISAIGAFCSGIITFKSIFDCLVPKHQEHYEELLLIRKKLIIKI